MRLGVQPLIFTAPHAIYLHRDDQPDHKPEDHTGYLAEVLAEETGASCITWSSKEVSRSARTSAPNPSNRDPNYLRCDELERNPWNQAVRACAGRWPPGACLLVDLHGRRDHVAGLNDPSDCDTGLGAMEAAAPDRLSTLRTALSALEHALGGAFVLNRTPRLCGCWPAATERCTVSQQAVGCGLAAVQLELSLRLRRELHASAEARTAFARALLSAALAVSSTASDEVAKALGRHGAARGEALPSPLAARALPPALCPLFVWCHPLELMRAWCGRNSLAAAALCSLPCHQIVFVASEPAWGWNGGAAGLRPVRGADAVHGALLLLSATELAAVERALGCVQQLQARSRVQLMLARDQSAGASDEGGGAGGAGGVSLQPALTFCPPMADGFEPPSVPQLCLLRRARQQFGDPAASAALPIRGADGRGVGAWRHPADRGGFAELPLDGLLAEVGVRLAQPWASAATLRSVHVKLASVGVHDCATLGAALGRGLNALLRSKGHSGLRADTLAVFRRVLQAEGYAAD